MPTSRIRSRHASHFNVNFRTVVHKDSGGICMGFPDTCKTPAPSVGGSVTSGLKAVIEPSAEIPSFAMLKSYFKDIYG